MQTILIKLHKIDFLKIGPEGSRELEEINFFWEGGV